MKTNQKGFTLVEGLLIVIALSLVVGVGYYVYNTSKSNKKTETVSQTTNRKTEGKLTEPQKRYLEVKELGVKFELNNKIKNAYYEKIDSYYYFSVHDFDNNPKLSDCGASKAKGNLGIVALVADKPGEDNGSPGGGIWTEAELKQSGLKKVGDTYYGFQVGNGVCFDPTLSDAQELANTISDYKKAFIDQIPTFTVL